jgi:hypothetical protein
MPRMPPRCASRTVMMACVCMYTCGWVRWCVRVGGGAHLGAGHDQGRVAKGGPHKIFRRVLQSLEPLSRLQL